MGCVIVNYANEIPLIISKGSNRTNKYRNVSIWECIVAIINHLQCLGDEARGNYGY